MTPVTCFGDSNGCITVTPAGGTAPFTHSWTNGATTANPCGFALGSYTDTITDANACQYIYANIPVTQPSKIFVSDSVVKVACLGQSNGAIYLTDTGGTPGYTYLWSNSSTSNPLTGIAVGPYEVTITDANHCTITDSIYVDVEPQMVVNANAVNVLCPPLHNGRVVLNVTGGTPGYLYAWSNGRSTSTISGLNVGTYTATITDSRGCVFDTTFTLTNDSAFSMNAIPDTVTINQGDTKQLGLQIITNHNGANAGTDITYTWDPSFGLSCADCPAPLASPVITTEYTIHAVTDSGCVSDSKTLITVIPQHQLYVPNTFTPNADGINDYWEIFGNKKAWIFCEAEVFDRWGEKIFQTNDINFQWDGKYRGTPVEPGVYTYVFKVVFIDDYSVTNKGAITIIR
jgi:gliding motility-associated-like protein